MGQRGRGKKPRRRRQSDRSSEDMIWVYGVHPVEEYLDLGGPIEEVLVARTGKLPGALLERLERDAVRAREVSSQELDELCEREGLRGSHQGVVLRGGAYGYADLDEVMGALSDREALTILALDQVQDVGNFGAILRSAAAFGVDAVVIPEHRAAGVHGAVIRASAGQALRVKVARVGNMTRALKALKEDHRCWVVGTKLDGDRSVAPWEVDLLAMRAVWVLGGEHGGMRRLVGEQCDHVVEIPMAPGVESLNVASAASVVLYETWRQRAGARAQKVGGGE